VIEPQYEVAARCGDALDVVIRALPQCGEPQRARQVPRAEGELVERVVVLQWESLPVSTVSRFAPTCSHRRSSSA
jgi:hypothetical protein